MLKKIIFTTITILLFIAVFFGVYAWIKYNSGNDKNSYIQQQTDETAITAMLEHFGKTLKNVYLTSPTAAADMAAKYKNFVTPQLLSQWQASPLDALGRLTSSPWPENIQIINIQPSGDNTYKVEADIIEITDLEKTHGGFSDKIRVYFTVQKFNDQWLIGSAFTEGHISTAGWQIFYATSTDALSFKYPSSLGTKYISTQDWPPSITGISNFTTCSNVAGTDVVNSANITKTIQGRQYCIKSLSEGAVGSIYTDYTYITKSNINNEFIAIHFVLRYLQCGNYSDAQRSECEQERHSFNLDAVIDQIAQTVE